MRKVIQENVFEVINTFAVFYTCDNHVNKSNVTSTKILRCYISDISEQFLRFIDDLIISCVDRPVLQLSKVSFVSIDICKD